MHGPTNAHPVSTWMIAGCGIWLIALGMAMALSGALTVRLMSATKFARHSDFRWVLLLPALVWLVGLATHVAKP